VIKVAILICAVNLAGCSNGSNQPPPFADIEKSTLAYANCINDKAQSELAPDTSVEASVAQVLRDCRELRAEALRLKAVPVMAKTVVEFDEIHNGLAQNIIAESRKKDTNAPNN
jgi:hypothetical protein